MDDRAGVGRARRRPNPAGTGLEMIVSRIEPRLLGRDGLIAFIEDTPGPLVQAAAARER